MAILINRFKRLNNQDMHAVHMCTISMAKPIVAIIYYLNQKLSK